MTKLQTSSDLPSIDRRLGLHVSSKLAGAAVAVAAVVGGGAVVAAAAAAAGMAVVIEAAAGAAGFGADVAIALVAEAA